VRSVLTKVGAICVTLVGAIALRVGASDLPWPCKREKPRFAVTLLHGAA
jgi:hypothetical protein